MFTIIGGDGQEYGPATADQLRAWIAAGRANLDTRAKAIGSDEWRRLGDFPEFAAAPPMLAPVALPAAETDLADRGLRLLARILDEIFSLLAALPGLMMLGWSFVQAMLTNQGEALGQIENAKAALGLVVLGLGLLAITVVQIWLLSVRGQTIAKIVFGIRIVKATDGARPGFVHGWLLRNFVPGLAGLLPMGLGVVFAIVDACFIFRQDRRCIHDLIAGTRVVKA